jgi:hypothetical protein
MADFSQFPYIRWFHNISYATFHRESQAAIGATKRVRSLPLTGSFDSEVGGGPASPRLTTAEEIRNDTRA